MILWNGEDRLEQHRARPPPANIRLRNCKLLSQVQFAESGAGRFCGLRQLSTYCRLTKGECSPRRSATSSLMNSTSRTRGAAFIARKETCKSCCSNWPSRPSGRSVSLSFSIKWSPIFRNYQWLKPVLSLCPAMNNSPHLCLATESKRECPPIDRPGGERSPEPDMALRMSEWSAGATLGLGAALGTAGTFSFGAIAAFARP